MLVKGIDNCTNTATFRSPKTEVHLFTSDSWSYASWWMMHKVDPHFDPYRGQKSSIKSCIGHKYICIYVYEIGCRLEELLPIFSARYSRDNVWGWNTTEFPRGVHSSRPMRRLSNISKRCDNLNYQSRGFETARIQLSSDHPKQRSICLHQIPDLRRHGEWCTK